MSQWLAATALKIKQRTEEIVTKNAGQSPPPSVSVNIVTYGQVRKYLPNYEKKGASPLTPCSTDILQRRFRDERDFCHCLDINLFYDKYDIALCSDIL